jgi:hypothetical protein
MADTQRGAFVNAGPCPASHPVRVPQVAYETLWDTTQFHSLWQDGTPNPFTLSYGDEEGYGSHADYLFGWKGDSLQRAMDSNCMFNACENGNPLLSQGTGPMNACTIPTLVNEEIDGCKLPMIPYLPPPKRTSRVYTNSSVSRAHGDAWPECHEEEEVKGDWTFSHSYMCSFT